MLHNGYEELNEDMIAIIEQMANNGFGFRVDGYCYIEVPHWGVVRLDSYDENKNENYTWPSYVPWVGY